RETQDAAAPIANAIVDSVASADVDVAGAIARRTGAGVPWSTGYPIRRCIDEAELLEGGRIIREHPPVRRLAILIEGAYGYPQDALVQKEGRPLPMPGRLERDDTAGKFRSARAGGASLDYHRRNRLGACLDVHSVQPIEITRCPARSLSGVSDYVE